MILFKTEVNKLEYIIATYYLKTQKSLREGAIEIAVGQSVGNPHMRSKWENDLLFEIHSCKILGVEKELEQNKEGTVKIAFPIINTNWAEDGVTQLMVQLLGGNLDIAQITHCRLIDLEIPSTVKCFFKGPKFGIRGIRKYLNVYDKPALGMILKPKTGVSPQVLLEMVKEGVEAGVNFIKEDEILSNPIFCPIEERAPLIVEYLNEYRERTGRNVIYCVCINSDYPYVIDRVKRLFELGINGIHVNFWNGLGVYKTIRDLDLPMFVHYQTSGLKILTDPQHRFSIDFKIICELAGLCGVDFFHAGMIGGYANNTDEEVLSYVNILREYDVCPTMSCGLSEHNVNLITEKIGIDYLANSGGAIHSHPNGTKGGVKAIKDKIDNFRFDQFKQSFYLHPISFSIHHSKIIQSLKEKEKLFAKSVPIFMKAPRDFDNEKDYYNDYAISYYSHTRKKGGIDCMRHYEILANGSIPYFFGLDKCPNNTLTNFPKELVLEGMKLLKHPICFFNDASVAMNENTLENFDKKEQYNEIAAQLLQYTKEHLTTRASAERMLRFIDAERKFDSVLVLTNNGRSDYLYNSLLVGLKELMGLKCVDFPRVDCIYDDLKNAEELYGMGFSYSRVLPSNMGECDRNWDEITRKITEHEFDLIINCYDCEENNANLENMIQFSLNYYKTGEIIYVCGKDCKEIQRPLMLDCHHCSYKGKINKGHHVFIRELGDNMINATL